MEISLLAIVLAFTAAVFSCLHQGDRGLPGLPGPFGPKGDGYPGPPVSLQTFFFFFFNVNWEQIGATPK